MHRVRSLLALALASSLTAVGLVVASPGTATGLPASAGPACSAFDDPIHRVVKPSNRASLVTPSQNEAEKAAQHGFTQNDGVVFKASRTQAPGLVPVHRLYRGLPQDFLASASPGEWKSAGLIFSYKDEGLSFYASPVAADCLVPVYRYLRGSRHRLSPGGEDGKALVEAGWKPEGVSFYAAPADPSAAPAPEPKPEPEPEPKPTPTTEPTVKPTQPAPTPTKTSTPPQPQTGPDEDDGDTQFSFAVWPDTQQEPLRSNDTRFIDRSRWLAGQKSALDLRWIAHSGDVVNWDTPDHSQYEMISDGLKPLEAARIPYTLTIGNHDTMATGVGGSARDPSMTRIYQRDTKTFNSYFTAGRYTQVGGSFEPNKVDNMYALYEAGGLKWMVLVLELWPRQAVVDWAKDVVASHPDHNVIMATHDFIDGAGNLSSYAGYGDTSPKYVYDNLIGQYPNIKMTVSGHTGFAGDKVLTGKNGNKIYSFLQTIHSTSTNPVRLVTVDTKAGTLKTWIYAPHTNETYSNYSKTISGVDFVR